MSEGDWRKAEWRDPQGDRMVPLCCQECGVQMGLRSPGPTPDPETVASYCFDCAPVELLEAAMDERRSGRPSGGEENTG